jgi:hypothetical protein
MDWRTTIPGLIGGLAMIMKGVFKIEIPEEVVNGIIAICFWLLGSWATSGRK